jgi:hypothetical protein
MDRIGAMPGVDSGHGREFRDYPGPIRYPCAPRLGCRREVRCPNVADTARQIADDVRAGRRTARAVVDEALARIAGRGRPDRSVPAGRRRGRPRAADELDARADKSGLALAGVPVAIKDNFDVAGFPTRHGSGATPETAGDR